MADDAPWLRPENAGRYVIIGKTVWAVADGTQVSADGAPDLRDNNRLVLGTTDKVFHPGEKWRRNFGDIGYLSNGADTSVVTLDGLPIDASNGEKVKGVITTLDHRRLLWMQGGDIWRAEIDWTKNKVINQKQLTHVGAFESFQPILWYSQQLYLFGNFDKDKPVVRVDLNSGETEEMQQYGALLPDMGTLEDDVYVSPNSCRIIHFSQNVIECFDARTGKSSLIGNDSKRPRGTEFEHADARGFELAPQASLYWSDDDTAYGIARNAECFKIDFKNSAIVPIPSSDAVVNGDVYSRIELHGDSRKPTQFVDATASKYSEQNPEAAQHKPVRIVIDVISGKRTVIGDAEESGVWVDDSHFIYCRTAGGLAHVGTYLFDRISGSDVRLTAKKIRDLSYAVVLADQKQVWSLDQDGTTATLTSYMLDGSGNRKLGNCALATPYLLSSVHPIDLGFTGVATDLWKPAVVDLASLAATQPAAPPSAKVKFLQDIQQFPPADRNFAEHAYSDGESNETLSNFIDLEKFSMKMLAQHKLAPDTPYDNLKFKIDYSDAGGDRDRIVSYGKNRAFKVLRGTSKYNSDQLNSVTDLTGKSLADAFLKKPSADVNVIDALFQKSLIDAQSSISGDTKSSGSTSTNQQNTPQNNQPAHQQPSLPVPSIPNIPNIPKKPKWLPF